MGVDTQKCQLKLSLLLGTREKWVCFDQGMAAELPPALPGATFTVISPPPGRVTVYARDAASSSEPPLLLVHSVSAASSAYDMHTLYDHYGASRPTYALDLPGFGLSDRGEGPYTPRLMTDAVARVTAEIRRRHDEQRIDIVGLSLSCEFVARAAAEDELAYRSVALVSPTGFNTTRRLVGSPESTRSVPGLHAIVSCRLWARGLFDLLTRPKTVRYYLEKTFGSKTIDEGLFDYDVLTAKQPGAEHAPLYFISGHLFSADITRVYESLTGPVWMSHGVRGDFVDYRGAAAMKSRPNWRFDVFQTGALPHLEVPETVIAAYDDFLVTSVRARDDDDPSSAR